MRSNYPKGFVTTLHQRDMPALRKAMSLPLESFITPKAGLYPEFETIEMLSTVMPGTSFASLLQTFSDGALLEGRYFFSNQDALLLQARKLEEVRGCRVKLLPHTPCCSTWDGYAQVPLLGTAYCAHEPSTCACCVLIYMLRIA